jgi:hypothetical protein
MGTTIFITTLDNSDLFIDANYFVEQMRIKWPHTEFHFITDPNIHSKLQWQIAITADSFVLGDLRADGISYRGGNYSEDAQLATWLRSIVPIEYPLFIWRNSLDHEPIEVTSEMTEADIIAGQQIPFDMSKYE